MKDLATVPYHAMSEKIVDIICKKVQNYSPHFFRILTAYHLAKLPAMMRIKILAKGRGTIPVNMFAINLAGSGFGKGYSTNIIETEVINTFNSVFMDTTFPMKSEEYLAKLATRRANVKGTDDTEELTAVTREFEELGPMLLAFDSCTTSGLKGGQHKLKMCKIGSMNFEMDEVGSNITGNADALSTMLELFDMGKIKPKLLKSSKDNKRAEEVSGHTPTNLIMFGTPDKLLDGGKTEEEFYSLLGTGYARRCFFGYTREGKKALNLTAAQIYAEITDTGTDAYLKDISAHLGQLANPLNHNKLLTMSDDVGILLIDYRMHCEKLALALGEHQGINKAELEHRYFKVLKLAGVYSFIDGLSEITEDNLYSAIRMAEESGEAFSRLLKRDKNHVKLAKYIADVGNEVTHSDLMDDLPFYKGSSAVKQDMLKTAIEWGYRHHILIKKIFSNGIEFISGETLKNTNMEELPISVSDDITINFKNMVVPFDKLHRLAQKSDLNWTAQHLKDGYRSDDNIIPGFSLVVLDVDDGTTIEEVRLLLKDYKALIYTTKRHTPAAHRFRVVMPTNYFLKLDSQDYKEFMNNIYEWLPFPVDEATNDRARKWLTNNGHHEYINGADLLDVMEFIPQTTKNDIRKKTIMDSQSLSNMERWFIHNTGTGNRSNQLIKYGLMQVDLGHDYVTIRNSIMDLNNKLPDSLTEHEVDSTIMISVSKALAKLQP